MSMQRMPERILTFYRSGPMPCPYLPGRVEQQLFADLSGVQSQAVFERLSAGGFRRSHHIAYRPACRGCSACVPVRVVVKGFCVSRRWRRVLRLNKDVSAQWVGKRITDDQYMLFHRYVTERHADGDMARMSRRDYAAMVVSSPVDTGLVEFRDDSETLIAVCLIDRMQDGLSAVYSFFEPRESPRSLGSYMVLWMTQEAAAEGLDFVYLGFWIKDSEKMRYKADFQPLEGFGQDGWYAIEDLPPAD